VDIAASWDGRRDRRRGTDAGPGQPRGADGPADQRRCGHSGQPW